MIPNPTSGLALRGLACGYRDKLVLDNLNVPEIAPGSLVALVGANAAGKSTLLRTLAGQLAPLGGDVMLGGESIFALPEHRRRKRVAYLPQTLPLGSSLYAWEAVLAASRTTRSDARAAEAEIEALFHRLGLAHIALRRLNQLSGGQRQLVGLAQLIVRQPQVLLLDEPTSALDPRWQLAVFDIVREEARQRGALALLAIHDLNLALRFCDRVLVLADGQLLADGTPGEAMTPAVLRAAYHIEGRVERCSQGGTLVVADKALPL